MAERILLVDGTVSLRALLQEYLHGLGYACDAMSDAASACERLASERYDLALTDIDLPGGSGFKVVEAAAACQPEVTVIAMAAFTDADDVIHAMQLGAYGFIRKPIPSFAELRMEVERALTHRRLLREREAHLGQIEGMNSQLRTFNETLAQEVAARTRELSEANRHLRSLDQMKNNLLANISHELRTPLVSVRGYVELFLHGQLGEMPEGADRYLGTCLRNIDRQLTLIDNLIGYAEVARGEVDLNIAEIDLCACLRAVAARFAPAAEAAGIAFAERFAEPRIVVQADRERLEQAVAMLFDNAIKFNRAGTTVRVRLETTAGRQLAIASVEDDGVGIAAEHLPHIFDRFYQCDGSATRSHGGTGMGLAIARDNLRLMGSELRVSSDPGRKTTFYWSMPIAGGDGA